MRKTKKDRRRWQNKDGNTRRLAAKAGILIEALPYMWRYANSRGGSLGGHAMGEQNSASFAADMTLLRQVGAQPIIENGGGPQIGDMLNRLQIESNL